MLRIDPRRLWMRYAVAISIFLILLLGGHFYQKHVIAGGAYDAEIINVGGRQRMLSQRILYLASDFAATRDASTGAMLRDAVDLFETSHARIAQHVRATGTASDHFFAPIGPQLDLQSKRFVARANAILARPGGPEAQLNYSELRDLALSPLLRNLDVAVKLFERAAADRLSLAALAADLTLFLAIAVLCLEAALIFWPAQKVVNRALDRLEDTNAAIAAKSALLEDQAKKLTFAAFSDPLTGLNNRKKLHEDLGVTLAQGKLDRRSVCVMHLDLDRFKEVNDTLGHAVGDAVLRRVAQILKARSRPGDIVARVGGDEFVIVKEFRHGEGRNRAQEVCDGLIAQIRAPMEIAGLEVLVGASIGYTFASEDVRDADLLISNADIALYEAKRAGKGLARPFNATMRAGIERRHDLVRDMERALDAGEFVPYFQPQISVARGTILGFEVLARWHHPERGCLTPSDFLAVADEIGMADAIDARIMLAGLDALSALRRDGWDAPGLSINASSRTMRYPDYAERLGEAVTARGLATADITVEVLETTLIEDAEDAAAQTISALAGRGFSIHVDDFGTGYASLASLSTLEIDGLKIDKSLTADIASQRTGQVFSAIVGLSEALQLHLVAEGVETPDQFAALKRIGVEAAQGFGIAHPMPFMDLQRWLARYGKPAEAARA